MPSSSPADEGAAGVDGQVLIPGSIDTRGGGVRLLRDYCRECVFSCYFPFFLCLFLEGSSEEFVSLQMSDVHRACLSSPKVLVRQ